MLTKLSNFKKLLSLRGGKNRGLNKLYSLANGDTLSVLSCIKCPRILMRRLINSFDIFPWLACCKFKNNILIFLHRPGKRNKEKQCK